MRVTARHEVGLPQGTVFAELLDFAAFERMARKSGLTVHRREGAAGEVAAWRLRAPFRGEMRDVDLRCRGAEPESRVDLAVASGGVEAAVVIGLEPLDDARTHVEVAVDLHGASLSARILLQSLRPVRRMIEARMTARLSSIIRRVEARHTRPPG